MLDRELIALESRNDLRLRGCHACGRCQHVQELKTTVMFMTRSHLKAKLAQQSLEQTQCIRGRRQSAMRSLMRTCCNAGDDHATCILQPVCIQSFQMLGAEADDVIPGKLPLLPGVACGMSPLRASDIAYKQPFCVHTAWTIQVTCLAPTRLPVGTNVFLMTVL